MADSYIEHFGILGQKWGVRRFQNPDGTLTEEGKRRYLQTVSKEDSVDGKEHSALTKEGAKAFVRNGRLTKEGEEAVKRDPHSKLSEAILNQQFQDEFEKKWWVTHNSAAAEFNRQVIAINKKWENRPEGFPKEGTRDHIDYIRDVGKCWQDIYADVATKHYGEHPVLGRKWLESNADYMAYELEARDLEEKLKTNMRHYSGSRW